MTYTLDGRSKTMTLAVSQVAEVRAAVKRYTRARADLDAAAEKGLKAFQKRRTHQR